MSSENLFLEKEKDLKCKIQELEKRLEVLDETAAISKVTTLKTL